jgi:outer membrane protein OmpA-like peptidoglycan-associated protein
MMRRAVRRVGRPSMLGTAARTAVVAGTATAVVGGVSHRQQEKAQQAADAQAYQQMQQQQAMEAAAQQAAAPAAAPAPDPIAELERLAQLKQQGILTDEEFAAAKAKVLGT